MNISISIEMWKTIHNLGELIYELAEARDCLYMNAGKAAIERLIRIEQKITEIREKIEELEE